VTLKISSILKASKFNDPGGTPGIRMLGGVQHDKASRTGSDIKIKKIETER
jgi:hypothetical protein